MRKNNKYIGAILLFGVLLFSKGFTIPAAVAQKYPFETFALLSTANVSPLQQIIKLKKPSNWQKKESTQIQDTLLTTKPSASQPGTTQTITRSNFVITDFSGNITENWAPYSYGVSNINYNGRTMCRVDGQTFGRCGANVALRDFNNGLGVRAFENIQVTVQNLTDRTFPYNPMVYMSWYSKKDSFALLYGYPEIETRHMKLGTLGPFEQKNFLIPLTNIPFVYHDFSFDPQNDLLGGIAISGPTGSGNNVGIVTISLDGASGATVNRHPQVHTGGYMVLKKKDGSEYRITDMNFQRPWGQPFQNLGYRVEHGDQILVYGVVNSGFTLVVNGTAENPIRITGATEDAALDGKGATYLALNDGLLYLDGDYFILENLEMRNCGLGYSRTSQDNASGIKTLGNNITIRNVTVHTCGHGYMGSYQNQNTVITDSEFFGNGYYGSGQHHNAYVSEMSATITNNYFHHSHGQNFKNRGCNTIVEGNLFVGAENMEIDYPGNDKQPDTCEQIFRGNTVVQGRYPDNRTQLLTFFEDNYGLGKKPHKIYVTNNTFLAADNVRPALVRIGENKTSFLNNNAVSGIRYLQFYGIGPAERMNGTIGESFNNYLPVGSMDNNSVTGSGLYRNVSGTILGNEPLLQASGNVFVPTQDSPLVSAGSNEAPYLPQVEFGFPDSLRQRSSDGRIDIGAFEYASEVCVENWTCTEWSECRAVGQTRTCTDTNQCGTEIVKPNEKQECTVCVPNWECGEWGQCADGNRERQCTDTNNCGININMPPLQEECREMSCTEGTVTLVNVSGESPRILQSRMYQRYGDYAYGSTDNVLREDNGIASRYNLLFSDIASYLPANATLTAAELELLFYHQYADAPLALYELTSPWEHHHASWKYASGAVDAQNGFAPSSSPKVEWQTQGGDVAETPVLQTMITNPSRTYSFTKTFDMTSVVQDWIQGTKPNYGVQLRAPQGEITDIFGTNRYNNTEYIGPKLHLQYSVCQEQ